MSETEITPQQSRRAAALAEMPAPLKKVAADMGTLFAQQARGVVLGRFYVGLEVAEVVAKPKEFGADAVESLARYFNLQPRALYDAVTIAKIYNKESIEKLCKMEMPDGSHATVAHVILLARVKSVADRNKLTTRLFEEGLSAAQLASELDAAGIALRNVHTGGGRPVSKPTSVGAGAQQIVSILQSLKKKADVWESAVFDAVDTGDVSTLDDIILTKLKDAEAEATAVQSVIKTITSRLNKNIVRAEKAIAASKAKDKTEADAALAKKKKAAKVAKAAA